LAMHQITATQFKARCLALLDQVAADGETLQITKHGRPVAELRPVQPVRAASPLGVGAGGTITGDLIAPVLEPSDWAVLQP
jgi:prevent-host-death family protein